MSCFQLCKMNDNDDDINNYVPSILYPKTIRKTHGDLTLTQNSIVSRCSLSLRKRKVDLKEAACKNKQFLSPTNNNNNNNSILRVRTTEARKLILVGAEENEAVLSQDKENIPNTQTIKIAQTKTKKIQKQKSVEECSIGFSAIEDIETVKNCDVFSPLSFGDLQPPLELTYLEPVKCSKETCNSLISLSSATELRYEDALDDSISTVTYYEVTEQPVVNVTFGVANCDTVNVSTKYNSIKNITVSRKDRETVFDCEMIENTPIVIADSDDEENQDENACEIPSPPKKLAVAVNLEIKKKKSQEENSKVLILKTDAIESLTHVIVQPPNYKLVKRQISDRNKFQKSFLRTRSLKNVKLVNPGLKQRTIDRYFRNRDSIVVVESDEQGRKCGALCDDMSRKPGAVDTKGDRHSSRSPCKSRKDDVSPPRKPNTSRRDESPGRQNSRTSRSQASDALYRSKPKDSATSQSPRKNVDSLQFSLSVKSRSNRTTVASPRALPYYKIVQGTNFAVDAFSYGDIPHVKYYFLTHFHSDHYAGLKKGFNKSLFCTKITADLCVARLGVNARYIHIINFDETVSLDGVDITAVDANHCPGAMMLLFTLPNGKSMLHTGDFRASPAMESYPIFWNKDVNTVYLDTTYCNPRYDFPTQDQSLEMALYYLRQKKLALEKQGKKFSSVLIVCGTYTIGKEKFFLGMARRVGCSVWACPEKDKVLQIVEGRSFSHAPPQACQLHVVPMRDLTHDKLHSYLDSLQGAFSEVVAFKPSGWENGKNSTVEKEPVTIHGIPYSEHSSFSELIRFVKFLKPQLVVPTVDISGGPKAVQKYFPCPLVGKDDGKQSRITDYLSILNRQQASAVT